MEKVHVYTCPSCKCQQTTPSLNEFDKTDLADEVLELCVAGPKTQEADFYAVIKRDMDCMNSVCDGKVKWCLKVAAEAVWEPYRPKEGPSINHFQNAKAIEIMSQDYSGVLFWYKHFDNYEDYMDVNDDDSAQGEEEVLQLEIIVKTFWNKGNSYLGLDYNSERIIRPIPRTQEGQLISWPREAGLDVGKSYTFTMKRPIDGDPYWTSLPHRREDRLVQMDAEVTIQHNPAVLFQKLNSIARGSVDEIFDNVCDLKYVVKGEDCPSFGVLRCHGHEIRHKMVNRFDKWQRRVQIENYDFPSTAVDADSYPESFPDVPTLVFLGLARPFDGNHGQFSPKRCYILVLRILQDTK